jgi:hypothetical protein
MNTLKTLALAGGLVLSLGAFSAAQAQDLPPLPPCFKTEKAAHDWINSAYDQLKQMVHERQQMENQVRQLKSIIPHVDPRVREQYQQALGGLEAQLVRINAEIAALEAHIPNNLNVKICPPERAALVPVPMRPGRVVIGETTEGGRTIRVIQEGGVRSVEYTYERR